jgi:NitT/TauT family transport system substrate-binding protein
MRLSGKRRLAAIVRSTIILAAIILAAMPMAVPQAARAADTLTVATTGKGAPPQWPVFIANAKGFFADMNLAIDLVATQSTAAAMLQVVAGSAEMGAGGLTDPMMAIDRGAKLALLRIETQIPPYSLFARPSIKSIKDLRGKVVIVGGAKDITMIYFERMAAPNGLKPGDYDLIYAGTTPARFAALSSGTVDAAILYPPASFKAAADGFSNIGNLGDYVKDLPFTGLAVNTDWAVRHKPVLVAFLKAYRKAVDWFYDPSHRAEAVDILMKESGATRDDVEKTYDYFTELRIYPPEGVIDVKAIASLIAALSQMGTLEGPADPRRFVNSDIAQLAAQAH